MVSLKGLKKQIIHQPRCIQGRDKRMRAALPSLRGPGSKLGMLAIEFLSRFLGQRRPKDFRCYKTISNTRTIYTNMPLEQYAVLMLQCKPLIERHALLEAGHGRSQSRTRCALRSILLCFDRPPDRHIIWPNKQNNNQMVEQWAFISGICSAWGYKGDLLTAAWRVGICTKRI